MAKKSTDKDKDLLGGEPIEHAEHPDITDDDALEGEYVKAVPSRLPDANTRLINRTFSLGEYSQSWSKMEWLLFTEIYEIVKNFFTDNNEVYVESYTQESLQVRVPVNMLNRNMFDPKNRSKQLRSAAEGLMDMRVRKDLEGDDEQQLGFDFISMFPRIRYDPKKDKDHMLVKIQSEIYEEMVPIQSFAQLEVKVMERLPSGNHNRLYAIIKSHSFKPRFFITFTTLRKQMGFFAEKKYSDWRDFSSKVLKPAVQAINKLKEFDIEVAYKKVHNKDLVRFEIKNFSKKKHKYAPILNLNEHINPKTRIPNRIQRKYIRSTMKNVSKTDPISNPEELFSWIISDLITMQTKQKRNFDFKHAMNSISKQIVNHIYTEPYSHKHLIEAADDPESVEVVVYDEFIHHEIKRLVDKGFYDEIRNRFTDAELKAHHHQHLIDVLEELEEMGEL